MMGLGKPQLLAKFVVASFSRCRNIKGKQKFWGAPLAQGHTHFSSGCDFVVGLGNCVPNLKSLALAVAEILKGNPRFWGAPLAQGLTHFFFWSDLMMGLGKP